MRERTFSRYDRSGTTMVEVIVAFFILIIILGIFSQAMQISGIMMVRSDDTLERYRNLAGSYYLEGEGDPIDGRASPLSPEVAENQKLTFHAENGSSSFAVDASVRTVRDGSGVLKDVVSTHTGSGGGGGGSEPGGDENQDEITYYVVCRLMTRSGDFTEGDYRARWNLDGHAEEFLTLSVKASKNDIGTVVNAPHVENYESQDTYKVPVAGGWVSVSYMPKKVPLKISHVSNGTLLDEKVIHVRYQSNVNLYSSAVFPKYVLIGNSTDTGDIRQASIHMDNSNGAAVTFFYEHSESSYMFYGKQQEAEKEIKESSYTGMWTLEEKIVYQDVLNSTSDTENSPQVGNYRPSQPTYQVPASNGSVTVEYIPDDVDIVVYHKVGTTLLAEPETLSTKTRYGAKLTLTSRKKLEDSSYKIDEETVTTEVKAPGRVEVVFTYTDTDNDAPFHPISGTPTVKVVSGEADERIVQLQEHMAEMFTDFFLNDWGKGSWLDWGLVGRYGYRTFTMKDGTKYAVVGYRGLEKTWLGGDIKNMSGLREKTGVETKNMLVLDNCTNGGFKNGGDAEILWQYLVENMSGLTTEEKEFMMKASNIKLQFTEEKKGGLLSYYNHFLEKITYSLPTDPETQIEITY